MGALPEFLKDADSQFKRQANPIRAETVGGNVWRPAAKMANLNE